jgi:hypothetical protein
MKSHYRLPGGLALGRYEAMVRIEHYTKVRIADPDGSASPSDFHAARNAVVRACRLHGPTGPFGVLPLEKLQDSDEWRSLWERGDPDAVYFVVDDQYNCERYQYIECTDPQYFTAEWILDLMAALREIPGWGIGIGSIPGGYALVFADRIMVIGRCFKDAHDLPTLVTSAQEAVRNKDKDSRPHRSGACKAYSFDGDRLNCKVEYFFDEGPEELHLAREQVEDVWRNPFTGLGKMLLKDESTIELPSEQAFAAVSEWFCNSAT